MDKLILPAIHLALIVGFIIFMVENSIRRIHPQTPQRCER